MTGHDKLIAAIQAKPESKMRDMMLEHVRAFEYHDFKSNHPMPKMQLVVDLGLLGYEDLAEKAMHGAYDNKPGE